MRERFQVLIDFYLFLHERKKVRQVLVFIALLLLALIVSWKLVFIVCLFGVYVFISSLDHPHDEEESEEEEGEGEEEEQLEDEETEMEVHARLTMDRARLTREIKVITEHVAEFPQDLRAKIQLDKLKDTLKEVEDEIADRNQEG